MLEVELIESENRRDEFAAESEPVVLSDGQEWWFPKPWIAIRPVVRGEEIVGRAEFLTVGPKLDALMDAIRGAEDLAEKIQAIQILGVHLLRRNYNLTDEEIATLLVFRLGDQVCLDWAQSIIEIATGTGSPKALSGGDT